MSKTNTPEWTDMELVCLLSYMWALKETKVGYESLQDYDFTDMAHACAEFLLAYRIGGEKDEGDAQDEADEFLEKLVKEALREDDEDSEGDGLNEKEHCNRT